MESRTAADTCEIRIIHADRVAATAPRIPDKERAGRLAAGFQALADPGRIRIIYALADAGELCVCDLAAIVDASESATSHQLRILRERGLVTFRKDGRIAYYRLTDDHVATMLDMAADHDLHEDR